MKYGVQIYGMRYYVRRNAEQLFKALAEAGVKRIEPCVVFDNMRPHMALWTTRNYEDYAPIWQKNGLQVVSCHVFAWDIKQSADELCAFAVRNGIQQLVLNCLAVTVREEGEAYADMLTAVAEKLAEKNVALLIHNGAEPSMARLEDQSAYEWVLKRCGGRVYAQPDVGWLLYGGIDPVSFLWRHQPIIRSIHYKDIAEVYNGSSGETSDVRLGQGLLDVLGCFQFARAAGIPQIIDQDTDGGDMPSDMADALQLLRGLSQRRDQTHSVLCICDADSGKITELEHYAGIIEAPNWEQGKESLIYNADGTLWRHALAKKQDTPIDTGALDNLNNDHVLSPDGQSVAVSHSEKGSWQSRVYIASFNGGEPTLATPEAPSFLHGWSPDGRELAYCAFRQHDGVQSVDVYTVVPGQAEKRLTFGEGFNDGPEYSPDGQHIWFNSTRTGLMQIWRMNRDGSEPTQMTDADSNNWFPHVSPDGRRVVYLSYMAGELEPNEHLPNMNVTLWIMNADGTEKRPLAEIFGGQGSINVNSWASDSRRFAFVRYEYSNIPDKPFPKRADRQGDKKDR